MELPRWEWLGKNIRHHASGADVVELDHAVCDALAQVSDASGDVLEALGRCVVLRQLDGRHVVAEKNGRGLAFLLSMKEMVARRAIPWVVALVAATYSPSADDSEVIGSL